MAEIKDILDKEPEFKPNADTVAALKEYQEMKDHPERYKRYTTREFSDLVDSLTGVLRGSEDLDEARAERLEEKYGVID